MSKKRAERLIASTGVLAGASRINPLPDLDPGWVEAIRSKVASWYREAGRPLPWREDRDPYRILVSEMMLVQTTVAAVVPYFARFLARFPTVEALAEAEEVAVLKAWEGLGYYRRARQLHVAAKRIVELHGGKIPDDPEAIRALPGVGRYIAGAILSFAFDRPAPILEANTQRVMARWLALRGDLKAGATQERLWQAAGRVVPPQDAGMFNQAFMELGALICTPRTPMCLVCPASAECRARALGLQDVLPETTPRAAPLAAAEMSALVSREDRVLIVRRGPGRLWDGFWEFPTIYISGADPAGRSFSDGSTDFGEGIRRLTGVEVKIGGLALSLTYGVTRHRVKLEAYQAWGLTPEPTHGPGLVAARWEEPRNLPGYPFSSPGRKLIAWVLGRARDSTGP